MSSITTKAMELSEQQIDELETFVMNPEKGNGHFAISNCDLRTGKQYFSKLKKNEKPTYMIFGSDGCGYTTYGMYKSRADKYYVIYVSIQTLKHFAEIKDESWFNCD